MSLETLSGARVLVIGGAGFIGSHVVSELLKEDIAEVVIYDNFSSGKMLYVYINSNTFEFIFCFCVSLLNS